MTILTHAASAATQPRLSARAVLAALADRPMPVLAQHLGRTVVAADPVEVIGPGEVWSALDERSRTRNAADALAGGLIGLLGYELAGDIERLPAPRDENDEAPTVALGRYDTVAIQDPAGDWSVHSVGPAAKGRELRRVVESARSSEVLVPEPDGSTPEWSLPSDAHRRAVGRARGLIRAGDCYQINLASKLTSRIALAPLDFAERLWAAAGPNRFSAYLGLPEGTVISASPERLLAVSGGVAVTEPIKGSAPLGAPPEELMSEKNRAEHVMIVDLMRNDLGRIATRGGVRVDQLMVRRPTSYIDHLVSDVRAEVRPGTRTSDLVRAVFPGGSVTGAPKVRAMEVIRELEPVNRGPAYGSVIVAGRDGSTDMSVAIRTAWLSGETASYWAGGAIVWDSDPDNEFTEAELKASPFLTALGL